MFLKSAVVGLCGLAIYASAGAYVAYRVRAGSLRDDPEHQLNAHQLLSIIMCWPHDAQTLSASFPYKG